MLQSHVIDIAGTFAGAAVHTADGYRFIAVDPRVRPLDRRVYATLGAVHRAVAAHLAGGGRAPAPHARPSSRDQPGCPA